MKVIPHVAEHLTIWKHCEFHVQAGPCLCDCFRPGSMGLSKGSINTWGSKRGRPGNLSI